jgi:hypothetical protein
MSPARKKSASESARDAAVPADDAAKLTNMVFHDRYAPAVALLQASADAAAALQTKIGQVEATLLHFLGAGSDEPENQDRLELAALMLNKGSDLEARDRRGETPLMWALKHWQWSLGQLLLDRGANGLAVDNKGISALHWTCARAHSGKEWMPGIKIAEQLLARGADPLATCKGADQTYWIERRDTPLRLAERGMSSKGPRALIELLKRSRS